MTSIVVSLGLVLVSVVAVAPPSLYFLSPDKRSSSSGAKFFFHSVVLGFSVVNFVIFLVTLWQNTGSDAVVLLLLSVSLVLL